MRTASRVLVTCSIAGILSACAAQPAVETPDHDVAALPDREAGAHTVLQTPLSVAPGVEAIVQDAVFAPDAQLPAHYHPGDEVLYMIEGTVVLEQDGQEPLTLAAGDAHVIPAGLVHKATAGPDGARAVIYRAHPEGEEIRYLVDEAEDAA